jgi:2-methylisocitrate lyase-like PEP mutase family enzyme
MQKHLKKMLEEKQLVYAPGVFDALTAKIAEANGFPAIYITGYGTAAAQFGYPDIGLLTMTEMVENAKRIADAVSLPIICDADTGYGNPINVYRTVREFEKAGVSAIHIEDQEWPKRCGHMSGKKLIKTEDMTAKIKSALDARLKSDFLIIARTDAIGVLGFEQAVERANLYAETGADLIFMDAPTSREQVEKIPALVAAKPNVLNLGPLTPNIPAVELEKMGYAVVIYSGICLAAVITALMKELESLKRKGAQPDFSEWAQSFSGLNEFLGVNKFRELENLYQS